MKMRKFWLLAMCILVVSITTLFTATVGAEVTPTVNPIMYSLTVDTAENYGLTSVTVTPPGQTIKVKTVFYYQPGTVVTLKANNYTYPAGGGCKFLQWQGDLTGSQNPGTITMNANKSVSVLWGLYDVPRRISPTPSRRITPTPTRRVTPTPTPTPNPNIVTVTFVIQSDWGNGCTYGIIIRNNTTTAIPAGWTLSWDFIGNQQITSLWNGTYTQSGSNVVLIGSLPIPANGGTVNLGCNVSGTGRGVTNVKFNGVPVGGV